jgi:hypothetical protein
VSGKFLVVVLLAASSASATTAGFVYTRLVAQRDESAATISGGSLQPAASVKTAVVLNASESLFGPVSDGSSDSAAPVCATESQGCITVMRPSGVRLNILGYTLTIPPLWLGGDSEDQYAATDNRGAWLGPPDVEVFIHPSHLHARAARIEPLSDGQNGDQGLPQSSSQSGSNNTSTTDGLQPAPSTENSDPAPAVVELISPPTDVRSGISLASPIDDYLKDRSLSPVAAPPDVTIPALSLPGSNPADLFVSPPTTFNIVQPMTSPAAPEPSTWLMMMAGLAALGFLKRRRIRAALTSTSR